MITNQTFVIIVDGFKNVYFEMTDYIMTTVGNISDKTSHYSIN